MQFTIPCRPGLQSWDFGLRAVTFRVLLSGAAVVCHSGLQLCLSIVLRNRMAMFDSVQPTAYKDNFS